jgi:hypothetical protein
MEAKMGFRLLNNNYAIFNRSVFQMSPEFDSKFYF